MGNLYQELAWEVKLQIITKWFEVSPSAPMIDTAGKYGAGLALEVIGEGLKKLGIKKAKVANAKNTPKILNKIFNNACPL